MERMGRQQRRPRPCIRTPMAFMARRKRRDDRPDITGGGTDKEQPRITPPHSQRMERSRSSRHGPAALPPAVPVLRDRRQAEPAAVPTQRRHIPWRTIQHRLVCTPADDGGTGDWA